MKQGNKIYFLIILASFTSINMYAQTNFSLNSGTSHLYWAFGSSSSWTNRYDTYNGTSKEWKVAVGSSAHTGADQYADDWNWGSGNADEGQDLYACGSGTVIYVNNTLGTASSCGNSYGRQVIIRFTGTNFAVRYAHLQSVAPGIVKNGTVSAGQLIGYLGKTGLTGTGTCTSHLHIVLYKNITNGSTALASLELGQKPTASCAAAFFLDAANQSDLSVQSPSASPTSIAKGSTLTASCTIKNNGTGATGQTTTLTYYLSSNSTYSSDDVELGTDDVSSLNAGATSSKSKTLTIPSSATTGTKYIIFRADATNAVTESNESNNIGYKQITITNPTITVSPTSLSFTSSASNKTSTVSGVSTYSVSDNQSWINATKSGSTVTVAVLANTSSSSRTGTVTVSATGAANKTISVTQSGATTSTPSNDNPCNAITLPIVSSWSYTTGTNVNATNTTNPGPTSSCPFYGKDVWYKFTATFSTMTIQMNQTGTATDMMMALYSGNCSSLVGLECDDDDGPGDMPKIVRSGLTVGATYHIRVWGYSGQTGTYGIAVRAGSYIANDGGGGEISHLKTSIESTSDSKVYPNPTTGLLTIDQLEIGGTIDVFNLSGQLQQSIPIDKSSMTVDLEELPKGTYLVKYTKGQVIETKKVELVK
ncbi:MAG: CARDB domain-containing protein [Chitinophagales bacterium]